MRHEQRENITFYMFKKKPKVCSFAIAEDALGLGSLLVKHRLIGLMINVMTTNVGKTECCMPVASAARAGSATVVVVVVAASCNHLGCQVVDINYPEVVIVHSKRN